MDREIFYNVMHLMVLEGSDYWRGHVGITGFLLYQVGIGLVTVAAIRIGSECIDEERATWGRAVVYTAFIAAWRLFFVFWRNDHQPESRWWEGAHVISMVALIFIIYRPKFFRGIVGILVLPISTFFGYLMYNLAVCYVALGADQRSDLITVAHWAERPVPLSETNIHPARQDHARAWTELQSIVQSGPYIPRRIWTNTNGREIKASVREIRKAAGGKLQGNFRTPDGEMFWIDIEDLTDEDQQRIREVLRLIEFDKPRYEEFRRR